MAPQKNRRLDAPRLTAKALSFAFALGVASQVGSCAERSPADAGYVVETMADGLSYPWGLAFLPSGGMLVTEKYGGVRLVREGVVAATPLKGGPTNILRDGDSGLLDVVLDPEFGNNQRIYITFVEGSEAANRLAVYRARFDGAALRDGKVIFRARPDKKGAGHSGGRIAFLPDGTMLVSVSDGRQYPEAAQNIGSHLGKIVRLDRDGRPPADNPFVGQRGAEPEIYTMGHRNVLGLAVDSATGAVWAHEMGPKGGDELNRIQAGANYGWPLVTLGFDYDGKPISGAQSQAGMVDPVVAWVPSISPSGLAVYQGDRFPAWRGHLFVGALGRQGVVRVAVDGDRWTQQEVLAEDKESRIREVRTGPDGFIYALTDREDGGILRLRPRP